MPDAVIVGAGPNGLAAAIELARNGRSVHVIEGAASIGGGTRTQELTLPGFHHDVCSAVHPLALGSPFLRTLPLEQFGLELIEPQVQAAHPLDGGDAVLLKRSLDEKLVVAPYASLLALNCEYMRMVVEATKSISCHISSSSRC